MARDAFPLLGWLLLLGCLLLLAWIYIDCLFCGWLAVMVLVGLGGVVFFFRDPSRRTPADENAIISGADGRVLHVSEVFEKDFFRDTVTRVAVFMSPLNVHVNRVPVNGQVKEVIHRCGKHCAAFRSKASDDNEHALIFIEGDRISVLMKQIAGSVARRIVVDVQAGDRLQVGLRIGMIRFGSRVDLFFPCQVKVLVKPGDHVVAGETIIGEIT